MDGLRPHGPSARPRRRLLPRTAGSLLCAWLLACGQPEPQRTASDAAPQADATSAPVRDAPDGSSAAPGAGLELDASLAVQGGTVVLRTEGSTPGHEICFSRRQPPAHPLQLGCVRVDDSGATNLRTPVPGSIRPGQDISFDARDTTSGAVAPRVTRTVALPHNVIVFVADDLGIDRIGLYNPLPAGIEAHTPRLDAMAADGLVFTRAYAAPNCSPTRSMLQTGRLPWRTGVGTALDQIGVAYLRPEETTLPEMLDQRTNDAYDHAAIGKWHLGSNKLRGPQMVALGLSADGDINFHDNPTQVHGWNWFAGTLTGPKNAAGDASYFDWMKYWGPKLESPTGQALNETNETRYTTEVHAYDAIERLQHFARDPARPWLMYVAFNAPHAPYVNPPNRLWQHTRDTCQCNDPSICVDADCSPKSGRYNAMVEALDHEMGRILDTLDADPKMAARTTVVFIGDNGTPDKPADDLGQGNIVKGTLKEGGIHVPFVVRSPLIETSARGGQTRALVSAADLFATMAELAGAPFTEPERQRLGLDSRSFVPTLVDSQDHARTHVVSELYKAPGLPSEDPNRHTHGRTIRNAGWKLHVDVTKQAVPGPGAVTTTTQRTEALYRLPGHRPEGGSTCTVEQTPTTDCTQHTGRAGNAYQELAAVEQSIRTAVDPLFGHCGDEAMDCPMVLPVRVMPKELGDFTSGQYVAERSFRLDRAALTRTAGGRLYLQGHRLGYRDGHEVAGAPVKDGKAAVALGSCDFKVLRNDDADIEIFTPERQYGGIGGGFRTVRLSIPLQALGRRCLTAGTNVIRFRFEGTDGVTSGYRIVDFNLRDAAGTDILPETAFVHEDPATWAAPSYDSADVDEGGRLFAERRLLAMSPTNANRLEASCADCHAHDGRDLEYFAYSNESIINRAVFHGLSEEQGEQIASWVRLHPAERHGRPWNPPYQPGPELDTRPDAVARWAAGAGIDAVLDDEAPHAHTILDALFPRGWGDAAIIASQLRGEGLPSSTSNLRQVPIAIQLPDWNAWLPETHPLDLWGQDYLDATASGSFTPCPGTRTPERIYLDVRDDLADGYAADDIVQVIGHVEDAARAWVACEATLAMGTEWRTLRSGSLDAAIARGYATDYTKRNLAQWLGTKNWEFAQEHHLENLGRKIYGEYGEALSWPFGNHQSVHPIAPHIVSSDRDHLQTPLEAEIQWQRTEFALPPPSTPTLYRDRWCFRSPADSDCIDPTDTDLLRGCPADVARCFEDFDYPTVHGAQTSLKGDYDSTAWYHLQTVLHAGARNPKGIGNEAIKPVDWPYGLIHIDDLARQVADRGSGPQVWESLRYLATLTKAYQMRDNGRGPGRMGWSMRDISPRLLVGSYRGYVRQDELWAGLDTLGRTDPAMDGLRRRVGDAFLIAFLDVVQPTPEDPHYTPELVQKFHPTGWPRHTSIPGTSSWWKLDPPETRVTFVDPFVDAQASRPPLCIGVGCSQPLAGLGTGDGAADKEFRTSPVFRHADHIYRVIPWMVNLGFDPCLVLELTEWAKQMWPGPRSTATHWDSAHGGVTCSRPR
ncbi:MAG: sulfatase-like hydrolase/transferase [Myxococcota bacterium]